ncbi:MAG: imidazole glycerol phosphate synthase subunit HisF [Aminivibrio sp.]|jgi:cyclase
MLYKRIIPQFLLKGDRLVKGTAFKDHIDAGDPVSQAKIYDAQGADEILIVDIEATAQGRTIPPALIERIVSKCRLPLTVGGGVRSLEDARRLFRSGADRVALNSGAVEVEGLLESMVADFGSQSVMVSIDAIYLPERNDWEVLVRSGTKRTGVTVSESVEKAIYLGAGEILLNSIDREGSLNGFDCALYEHVRPFVTVPLIASGGAGCYDHIVESFRAGSVDACCLGKMLALRDYDIVRIKSYLHGRGIAVRED